VIGGPFEGKFRNAAVIHDAACEVQAEPWEDVHRMFYDACRCGRVGIGKAQTMYWAVYQFGPRWHRVTEEREENGQQVTFTRLVLEQPPQPDPAIVPKAERYFNKLRFTQKEIEECTVADIENEVAKWDAKRAAGK
jgi:hypothetical protein